MLVFKSTYELLLSKYETLMTTHKLYVKKCNSLRSECDELLSDNIKKEFEIKSLHLYIKELQNGNTTLTYMEFNKSNSTKFERLNRQVNEIAEEIRQKSRETPPQSMSHYLMTQDTSSSRDYSSDSSSCSSSSSSSSSDSSSCSSSD